MLQFESAKPSCIRMESRVFRTDASSGIKPWTHCREGLSNYVCGGPSDRSIHKRTGEMGMGTMAELQSPVRRMLLAALVAATLLPAFAAQRTEAAPDVARRLVSVIVESWNGSASAAATVERVGGRVTETLPIVDGVTARVPADRVDDLERYDHIGQVTPNDDVSFNQSTSTEFDLKPARVQK